jgi:hypothetical protein
MTAAYSADSQRGRMLLALRAGAMETLEINERFSTQKHVLVDLERQRLVTKTADGYRITSAGRAACPFRNPLLAPKTGAEPPTTEEIVMPKGIKQPLNQESIMAIIRRAGPDGITRRDLVRCFAGVACESLVDRWIAQVVGAMPPLAYRPKHGHIAAFGAIATALATEAAKIEREYRRPRNRSARKTRAPRLANRQGKQRRTRRKLLVRRCHRASKPGPTTSSSTTRTSPSSPCSVPAASTSTTRTAPSA